MLEELRIAGLGVIEEAELQLGPGLTVLTGETGAGKTMLVTALLLMFGGRADPTRVRAGTSQASVDGRLILTNDTATATRVADVGGALDEDGSLVLRRTVAAAGRSRAFIGGAPAPIVVLAELADGLVAVHGQSDQLRLMRPTQHRAALDEYAGIDIEAFTAWRQAQQRLTDRRSRSRELRLEAELLQNGLREIDAVAPQPGEDAALARETNRLAQVDALRLAASAAHDALAGDPDDPGTDSVDVGNLLGRARRALHQVAGADADLDAIDTRLVELSALANELSADLSSYREQLDADPQRLAQAETRRSVLGALLRRYGPELSDVLEWASTSRRRLAELDGSEHALDKLSQELDATAARAAELAAELSRRRGAAAERLATAVTTELAGLAMGSARVRVDVRARPAAADAPTLTVGAQLVGAGPSGVDIVEIQLQPHPESPSLPLGRGASGGELSRVMLALEVCLADTNPVPTMVFDEVDAGVGGRAAVELGRRLAVLSHSHQVIVVTHLAQVAAFADRHIVIDRPAGQAGVTKSDVRLVEGAERIAELARMLAGRDSVTARQHAAELIESAANERTIHHQPRPRQRPRRVSKTGP